MDKIIDTAGLEVAGIKKIIWIDDDFADNPPNKEKLVDSVVLHIETFFDLDEKEKIIQIDEFKQVNFHLPQAALLESVRSVALDLTEDVLLQLISNFEAEDTELTPENIDHMSNYVRSAGIELVKLPLSGWRQCCSEYSEITNETLFLIDKEFEKEGAGADAGTELLKELLKKYKAETSPNFILFTHTCKGALQEEELRKGIFKAFTEDSSFEVESFNFQVLSKSVAYDKDAAENRLFSCIRAIFVRKIFSQMAYGLKGEIISSIDDITERLISTNVYGLDRAIFGSSIEEGVSELDLLHRIYSLSQKTAVSRFVSKNDWVVRDLSKLRQLKIQSNFEIESIDQSVDFSEFTKIRREEFWFTGEDINTVYSPIMSGDVFQFGKREFILISQPCDTILRKDGKRKANAAVLIPLKKHCFDTEDEFNKKYNEYGSQVYSFVFKETSLGRSFWLMNFNLAIPINLDILDFSSLNPRGAIEFSVNQELPDLLHLAGQINRFHRFKELSDNPEGFPIQVCLETGVYKKHNTIKDLEYKEGEGWSSELIRIRRLDSLYAEHALNQYFSYKSRKAFDHDFTQVH